MNEVLFLLHVSWVSLIAFLCRKQSMTIQAVLMTTYALLGNLMVLKQMTLFGLSVTTADVYAVGVILVLNYIREAYNDEKVHQAMLYSFGSLVILALAAYFQISYIALASDEMSAAYLQIMARFPKIVIVSAVVYLVVQYIDNRLFSWMKRLSGDKWFIGRVMLSLVFSQVLDTVLFSIGALGDIAVSILDIIVFSSLIKIICSIAMVINTMLSEQVSAWIKR